MKIGSHVNNSGNNMLLGSVNDCIENGANVFMVYVGPPQNTIRRPLSQMKIPEMKEQMRRVGLTPEDCIVHAPYILNLAQQETSKFQNAVDILVREIGYLDAMGAKYMVVHPGAHMGAGIEAGLSRIASGIDLIHSLTAKSPTVILLETMAGKGTECGSRFEELEYIIAHVSDKSRIGVCFDTCHVNDAGYDLSNYDKVISQFANVVGLEYLKVIHLNDSKNPLGSKKDRHENIGFGTIGFETLSRFWNDERFKNVPIILETPYVESPVNSNISVCPYKEEIKMIKANKFNPDLIQILLNEDKVKRGI